MTPEFASVMRRRLPRIILVVLLIVLAYLGWKIAYGGGIYIPPLVNLIETVAEDVVPDPPAVTVPATPPEPQDEWLVVMHNNVLLWPVVESECQQRSALMQVHEGERALVISRQGSYVEVALNNQSLPHTHGCIHESMLVPDDGQG